MRVATKMQFPPIRSFRRRSGRLGETGDQDSGAYIPGYGLNYPAGMTPDQQQSASTTANQIAAINAAAAAAAAQLAAATAAANAAAAAHQATILPTYPQGNPATAQAAQTASQTQTQAAQALANLLGSPVPLPDGSNVVPDGSTAVGAVIYGDQGYVPPPAGPAVIGMPPIIWIALAAAALLILK